MLNHQLLSCLSTHRKREILETHNHPVTRGKKQRVAESRIPTSIQLIRIFSYSLVLRVERISKR
jgi:hypothetical protein